MLEILGLLGLAIFAYVLRGSINVIQRAMLNDFKPYRLPPTISSETTALKRAARLRGEHFVS